MKRIGVSATEGRSCCCKRSTCRKKYCECFRLKKLCTSACKCIGCCNKENHFDDEIPLTGSINLTFDNPFQTIVDDNNSYKPTPTAPIKATTKKEVKKKVQRETTTVQPVNIVKAPEEPVFINFISNDVVEAAIQCMLAQAKECIDCELSDWQTERMIIHEFDRCLVAILNCMGIIATTECESSAQPTEVSLFESNPSNDAICNSIQFLCDDVLATQANLEAIEPETSNTELPLPQVHNFLEY